MSWLSNYHSVFQHTQCLHELIAFWDILLWGWIFPGLVSTWRLICLESCCEILSIHFLGKRTFYPFYPEARQNKSIQAIWTSSLHAQKHLLRFQQFLMNPPLPRTLQWLVQQPALANPGYWWHKMQVPKKPNTICFTKRKNKFVFQKMSF